MSSFSISVFATTEPSPWKNGLGVTTQLAIHPASATFADFEWRVSIARMDADAPFSLFSGVDRCLAVLAGELKLDGLPSAAYLTPDSDPLTFSGSVTAHGVVIRGPVLDLNVMYRPAQRQATMRRIRYDLGASFALTENKLLCSLQEGVQLTIEGKLVQLGRYDLLIARGDLTVECATACDAYLIEFTAKN